jgi:glycosyltransferase involved in cell wall biosynthesis
MQEHPWVLVAGGFHQQGGMDRANFALAKYLVDENVPVHLVTHFADAELAANPLVKVHSVPRPGGSFFLGYQALDFRGRRVARAVTSRCGDSKVVVNGGSCLWPGINWSHYVHHAWRPEDRSLSPLNRLAKAIIHSVDRNREKAAYDKARLILANSDVTRCHLLEHFKLDPRRVKTLYLGSNPEWHLVTPGERDSARRALNVPPSRFIASFVGGVGSDDRKGMDTVVAAWKLLCTDPAWDVDLLVAGSGRALPVWRAKISSWGLQDRIRMLGFCNNIRELLAGSDLLVSPVRYEAYGLNVHEAICCGVPSIVSASAGVAEQYPPEVRAFLLPNPEDAAELAQRLKMWRANIDLWKTRFNPFSSLLRGHTWRDMARNFVSLVDRVESEVPAAHGPSGNGRLK